MGFQMTPENIDKIQAGLKSRTRRPFEVGDILLHVPLRVRRKTPRGTQLLWQVGKDYAAVPGRGQKEACRIELTSIELDEDVRFMSLEDAQAEGYESVMDFLAQWVGFYDKTVILRQLSAERWHVIIPTPKYTRAKDHTRRQTGTDEYEVTCHESQMIRVLQERRPARLYKAWSIGFRLVTPAVEASAQTAEVQS